MLKMLKPSKKVAMPMVRRVLICHEQKGMRSIREAMSLSLPGGASAAAAEFTGIVSAAALTGTLGFIGLELRFWRRAGRWRRRWGRRPNRVPAFGSGLRNA